MFQVISIELHSSIFLAVKKSQDKYLVQDEVDKNVVIKNVQQEILPSIPIQSTDIVIKEVDLLKKLNSNSTSAEDDNSSEQSNSVDGGEKTTVNKESASNLYAKSFTPDIVPKSFQDKRYIYNYTSE